LKEQIIRVLHFVFGYERYLMLFSIIKIKTLALDRRKSDFLFFTDFLPENSTIIVVGACTGITTVPFAKNKPNRLIIAYEPLSTNFKVLNKVVCHYNLNNIKTFNIGLGNKSVQKEMILPVIKGVKKHGMAHIKDNMITQYNEGLTEIIDVDILDNRNELDSLTINAIKIVAENFEFQIFEGAKKLIETNRPLIYCELWNNELKNKVLELIKTYKYNVYYRKGNNLIPYIDNNYTGKNFFLKPTNE